MNLLTCFSSQLYTGVNGQNQKVLTWVATEMTEKFSGDIAPLITTLATIDKVDFPLADLYLGHLGMGSEAFWANQNVTLSMPIFAVDIQSA